MTSVALPGVGWSDTGHAPVRPCGHGCCGSSRGAPGPVHTRTAPATGRLAATFPALAGGRQGGSAGGQHHGRATSGSARFSGCGAVVECGELQARTYCRVPAPVDSRRGPRQGQSQNGGREERAQVLGPVPGCVRHVCVVESAAQRLRRRRVCVPTSTTRVYSMRLCVLYSRRTTGLRLNECLRS